jgi:EmrB/QacA subfamily drug resistance transporter
VRRTSPYVALIPICLGVFVAADDQTVIVTVLQDIMLDFRIPPTELDKASWTITAYLLGYVAAMPLVGSMSDAFGHRRMFAWAMVIFMGWSVAAALAPNLSSFITFRVLQAVGAGAMLPIAIAIIGDLFPRGNRGLAFGLVGGSAEAGGVIGPLWGGLVGRYLDWPWVFWMNIPLGVIVLIALFMLLGPSPRYRSKVDYLGGIFLAVSLASLTVGLSRIDRLDLVMAGYFLLAGAALAAFVYRQRNSKVTLLPNAMFRSVTVLTANTSHLLIGVALIIGMVSIPYMTTYLMGHSALEGGLRLMRMTVAMPIGAIIGGLACQRMDYRLPTVLGLILVAGGYGLMTGWGLDVGEPSMTIHLAMVGLGFGLVIAPIALGATEPVGHRDRGAAAGLVTAMRLLGMTFGLAAITAWGAQRFSLLVSDVPLPLPTVGETTAVTTARIAEFQTTVTTIGMDLFVEFFIIAAVVSTVAIVPALLMAWNQSRSKGLDRKEASANIEPEPDPPHRIGVDSNQ